MYLHVYLHLEEVGVDFEERGARAGVGPVGDPSQAVVGVRHVNAPFKF